MRHIHICDPQLQHSGGHYLSHDTQLVRDLQRRPVPVSIYGRCGGRVAVCGLAPEPIFTQDIFQEASADPHTWAIDNFQAVNAAFFADLCRINTDRFTPEDLVYFPNLIQNQLYAVALWMRRIPADRRPAVAVMLRFLNHAMDYVQQRAHKDLIGLYYRYAARALMLAQPRALLCADTRELAETYQGLTGFPVVELPNPMDVSSLLVAPTEPSPPDRPLVVYQGHTSPLRGFHFLPEIIERAARMPSRPRFIVHAQNRETSAITNLGPTLARLDRLAGENVSLVNGALEAADYLALLQRSDIVLLPYSPTFYGHGSSGVFTEAASLGKVLVVSPATVPARQSREFGLGVVIAADWSAAAMADALGAALDNLPSLQAKSIAAAPRFRADQCAATLWDRLFAAIQPGTSRQSAAAAA